jgi:prevent-host-death family protein
MTTSSRGEAEVGVRELKARLSHHLSRVKAGRTLVVTERGREIARLVPAAAPDAPLPASVQRLLREGAASWSGGDVPDFEPVPLHAGGPATQTLAETVSEDRR